MSAIRRSPARRAVLPYCRTSDCPRRRTVRVLGRHDKTDALMIESVLQPFLRRRTEGSNLACSGVKSISPVNSGTPAKKDWLTFLCPSPLPPLRSGGPVAPAHYGPPLVPNVQRIAEFYVDAATALIIDGDFRNVPTVGKSSPRRNSLVAARARAVSRSGALTTHPQQLSVSV